MLPLTADFAIVIKYRKLTDKFFFFKLPHKITNHLLSVLYASIEVVLLFFGNIQNYKLLIISKCSV